MGRYGIKLEDVEKAVRQIQASGKNPTIDAVRQVLGSGSKSTINRHLHTLKTRLPDHESIPHSPPETQTGLPSEVLHLVSALWEKLQGSHPAHEDGSDKGPDLDLIEKYSALQQAYDQITRQLQIRTRICSQVEEKLTSEQQLLKISGEELHKKIAANQELARRVRLLAADLQQAKISIHHLQQQISVLENTQRTLTAEKERLAEKIKNNS